MRANQLPSFTERLRWGALAGVSGGLVEIFWIGAYGALTGKDVAKVARSISSVAHAAVPEQALSIADPVATGIAIHMIAAVVLGVGLVMAWHAISDRCPVVGSPSAFMLIALGAVWGLNFFVILPLVSPAFADVHGSFVELIPYPVSLASKLLFGLAAAAVLHHQAARPPVHV